MFYRIYGKDAGPLDTVLENSFTHYTILGIYADLKTAANSRELAGDLIFDENGFIVKNKSWLWDWEKQDEKSYAHRCIIIDKTFNGARNVTQSE